MALTTSPVASLFLPAWLSYISFGMRSSKAESTQNWDVWKSLWTYHRARGIQLQLEAKSIWIDPNPMSSMCSWAFPNMTKAFIIYQSLQENFCSPEKPLWFAQAVCTNLCFFGLGWAAIHILLGWNMNSWTCIVRTPTCLTHSPQWVDLNTGSTLPRRRRLVHSALRKSGQCRNITGSLCFPSTHTKATIHAGRRGILQRIVIEYYLICIWLESTDLSNQLRCFHLNMYSINGVSALVCRGFCVASRLDGRILSVGVLALAVASRLQLSHDQASALWEWKALLMTFLGAYVPEKLQCLKRFTTIGAHLPLCRWLNRSDHKLFPHSWSKTLEYVFSGPPLI